MVKIKQLVSLNIWNYLTTYISNSFQDVASIMRLHIDRFPSQNIMFICPTSRSMVMDTNATFVLRNMSAAKETIYCFRRAGASAERLHDWTIAVEKDIIGLVLAELAITIQPNISTGGEENRQSCQRLWKNSPDGARKCIGLFTTTLKSLTI